MVSSANGRVQLNAVTVATGWTSGHCCDLFGEVLVKFWCNVVELSKSGGLG